jgi:hypothetical protein
MKPEKDSQLSLNIFSLRDLIQALDRVYPRLISQIDRDPDSPTFGSCDRHFWMYKLNDFDSGVLQQCSLTFAALDALADEDEAEVNFKDCQYLEIGQRAYWKALAEAINNRTVSLLSSKGWLDEYYPGEQSFPATVFASYATLKSAKMLGQKHIIESPIFEQTAFKILNSPASKASNQNVAGAAFLWLYSKELNWRVLETQNRIQEWIGVDGENPFLEYGGRDLGYSTVTLNYLAHNVLDGNKYASPALIKLAKFVSDFTTSAGLLGGEFAARSTTYFLPFGLIAGARQDGVLAESVSRLNMQSVLDKLDDRYLFHYYLPSLAMSCLSLAKYGVPVKEGSTTSKKWEFHDYQNQGLVGFRNKKTSVFVGLNKGGSFQVSTASEFAENCGYRIKRNNKVFENCVLEENPKYELTQNEKEVRIVIQSSFKRYRVLVASPLKTIVLRLVRIAGPLLNTYFKKRFITSPLTLSGPTLIRKIKINIDERLMTVEDQVKGLSWGDLLYKAPISSFRLVPSGKLYLKGEEIAFLECIKRDVSTVNNKFDIHLKI